MIRRFFTSALLGLTLAAGLLSPGAEAATLSFVIDKANSWVTLTQFGGTCNRPNCGYTASLADGLTDGAAYRIGTGETATFDFLTLQGKGNSTYSANYDVKAVLAFSSPLLKVAGTGALLTTVSGRVVDGKLTWNAFDPIRIHGSTVQVAFSDSLFASKQATTTASITGIEVVPLPASGLLLAGALGGLGLARRKRKTRTA